MIRSRQIKGRWIAVLPTIISNGFGWFQVPMSFRQGNWTADVNGLLPLTIFCLRWWRFNEIQRTGTEVYA